MQLSYIDFVCVEADTKTNNIKDSICMYKYLSTFKSSFTIQTEL